MATYTLPDGTVYNAPDDMDPQAAADAIKQHQADLQQQQQPATSGPAGVGSEALRLGNVAAGAVARTPLDFLSAPGALYEAARTNLPIAAALPQLPDWTRNLAGTVERNVPVVGNWMAGTEPQTTAERYFAGATSGAASALLPGAMVGKLGGLANAARTAGMGLTSGLGAQAGADVAPSNPMLGALVGGTLGGNLGGFVGSRFGANPITAARSTLGMSEPALGGPGTEFALARQNKTAVGARDDYVSDFNQAVGPGAAPTKSQAGTQLTSDFNNWRQDPPFDPTGRLGLGSQVGVGQVFDYIHNRMGTTPGDVGPIRSVLNSVAGRYPGDQSPFAQVFQSPYFQKVGDALDQVAPAPNGTLPWTTLRNLRTNIGTDIKTAIAAKSPDEQAMRQLYGAVAQTMQNTIDGVDPSLGAVYKAANARYEQVGDFTKQVGKQTAKTPGKAANTVLGDATMLQQLRREMPQTADTLAQYQLGQLAKNGPSDFLTRSQNLDPDVRAALFPQGTPMGDKFGAAQTVANDIQPLAAVQPSAHGGLGMGTYAAMEGLGGLAETATGGLVPHWAAPAAGYLASRAFPATAAKIAGWTATQPWLRPGAPPLAPAGGPLANIMARARLPATATAVQPRTDTLTMAPGQ